MILHMCCFQVFPLTALVVRGPSELHPVFTLSLDGVAINHEDKNGAVACDQDFVRHPVFTHRKFFPRLEKACRTLPLLLQMLLYTAPSITIKSCRAAKEDSQRYTGEIVLVQNLLQYQLLVRLRPVRLSASTMLLRQEMFSISRNIINLESFVALDLCQDSERVRKAE